MKRRNLFKLALCAVAASAMEVCGLAPISAPSAPKIVGHILWQRTDYTNDGKPLVMYCLSDSHPDELTHEELDQAMKDGQYMAALEVAYTNSDSVVMERKTDNNVVWKGIIPDGQTSQSLDSEP